MEACSSGPANDTKEKVFRLLRAYRALGSDGGLGGDRLWILLDRSSKKVKKNFPDVMTLSDLMGVEEKQLVSLFGKKWKREIKPHCGLGAGVYVYGWWGADWVTVANVICNDVPEDGTISTTSLWNHLC